MEQKPSRPSLSTSQAHSTRLQYKKKEKSNTRVQIQYSQLCSPSKSLTHAYMARLAQQEEDAEDEGVADD